jgi:hypothetical protein
MSRARVCWLTALAVALVTVAAARADNSTTAPSRAPASWQTAPPAAAKATCAFYSLADVGDDADLGQWLERTVPQMIQPGSWHPGQPGYGSLNYYAPGKILVVYHTPAVQAEVTAFLQKVKKAMAQQTARTAQRSRTTPQATQELMPAAYSAPALLKPATPAVSTAYPVPAPLQQPKHLFHFVVSYNGEGSGDSAVTGLIKGLTGQGGDSDDSNRKTEQTSSNAPQLRQSFNFIIRYEGEGLIDSTVAGVLKEIYGANAAKSGTCSPTYGTVLESLGGRLSPSNSATTMPRADEQKSTTAPSARVPPVSAPVAY